MKSSSGVTSLVFVLSTILISTSAPASAAITVSPALTSVATSTQTQQFTASMNGVTWSVDNIVGGNSTVGTISASGLYTPPAKAGIHTITASSGGSSGSAKVGVTDLAGVLTYHNDQLRDGVNSREFALSSATLTTV